MMELMTGILCYVQVGLLGLAALFTSISYGAGVFWELEQRGVELSFTLWTVCSTFEKNEVCHSINSDNYLEEVILTGRASGGISLLLMAALLAFCVAWICAERRMVVSDLWLHARTFLLLLLVLFMLILLAHSSNCPPKYLFGLKNMSGSVGWGWGLTMTSFVFVIPVCLVHCFEEFQLYRSNRNKT